MNSKKDFFNIDRDITDMLMQYAPSDDKLLDVPFIPDPNHPLASLKVNGEVCTALLYAQCINRTLSKTYALFQYIYINGSEGSESNIMRRYYIFIDYMFLLRAFISMLKILVEQLILFLELPKNKGKHVDSIGRFLQYLELNPSDNDYWNDNKKFLTGLNAAANFIKHRHNQFDAPKISPLKPRLFFIFDDENKESKRDCERFKDFFPNQLQNIQGSKQIVCWIDYDFLVSGFNGFLKKIL